MAEYLVDDIEELKPVEYSRPARRTLGEELDVILNDTEESIILAAAKVRQTLPADARIAFVSGNFNIVHPGHLRLLNFAAECADFLIVGLNDDTASGTLVPQNLRLKGLRSIDCVDLAIALPVKPEKFVAILRPDIVVKGSEHQQYFNPEQQAVESYGGKLLFSSGEMRFSSLDLLRAEMQNSMFSSIKKPTEYLHRHNIHVGQLPTIVRRFTDLSVVVIGDLIIDEYITCDPLGLSREDPTIVVTPIKRDIFVGGAGIVSAHASALGAKVQYFSVVGDDDIAAYARKALEDFEVEATLIQDSSRPTTLKQRYRADSKTLLRVSHLRHHQIDSDLASKMLKQLAKVIKTANLVVFSDFNYGCLPQSVVDAIVDMCKKNGVPMVADSQSSSQIGDISRYHGMMLVTPTEHEARLAVHDQTSGLMVLADKLSQKTSAEHVFITLGAEGLLMHSPHGDKGQLQTDQLPAFNKSPKDVSGGGDSLLISSSLALAAGASVWESAYLGSIAAACHVSRTGNMPLSIDELLQEIYL